jgi:hypothetical protein
LSLPAAVSSNERYLRGKSRSTVRSKRGNPAERLQWLAKSAGTNDEREYRNIDFQRPKAGVAKVFT